MLKSPLSIYNPCSKYSCFSLRNFYKNMHRFYNLAVFVFFFHLILFNVFSKILYRSALRTMKMEHSLYIDLSSVKLDTFYWLLE